MFAMVELMAPLYARRPDRDVVCPVVLAVAAQTPLGTANVQLLMIEHGRLAVVPADYELVLSPHPRE